MRIRSAGVADAEWLVRLHYDAVHAAAGGSYSQSTLESWAPPPDERRFSWMRAQIGSAQTHVLVAESRSGELAGFCMFSMADGFIHAVYVAPGMFRKGVGRQLLKKAEDTLAAQGIAYSRLNASTNALAFYLSAGYELLRSATQVLSDGTRMDCHEMRKVLAG